MVDWDGLWTDVCAASAREESCRLVVLVGAQMERATGGALKAVRHRVVAQRTHSGAEEEEEGGGVKWVASRRSLVFRLRARHTAVLDPLKLAPKYVRIGGVFV